MLQACDMLSIKISDYISISAVKTPTGALNNILGAQLLQENQNLKEVAKKLLRVRIPPSEDSRRREKASPEHEHLKSHPINFSSSPMSEDFLDATAFSDTEGWYAHVVLDKAFLLGITMFAWNETMESGPLAVVVVLDWVATYLCSLPD